ncbi:hypothetical protein COO60DRAFT_1513511 [Scenedesmus sp. NREL 46B-D3]|nr:hypothetical protein COO60DRAFT_1513511 [Scenedesmus sp. NREL 46B-D3]
MKRYGTQLLHIIFMMLVCLLLFAAAQHEMRLSSAPPLNQGDVPSRAKGRRASRRTLNCRQCTMNITHQGCMDGFHTTENEVLPHSCRFKHLMRRQSTHIRQEKQR